MKSKRGNNTFEPFSHTNVCSWKKFRTLILTQASDATTCKATQAVRKWSWKQKVDTSIDKKREE